MKMAEGNINIICKIVFITILLLGGSKIGKPCVKNYSDPYHKKVEKLGFVEKSVQIGETNLCYTEGPNNGPALVLLHAQLMDWFDYSRVLPKLSKLYHIFVVDYNGHGRTIAPASSMNANTIGGVLAKFMESQVKEPAFVSGNSSGGLLTVWLAANRPELVKAILLEDPPLFSSEYPRIKQTIAYRSFTTSNSYIEEKSKEPFLNYWIAHSSKFIERYAGENATPRLLGTVNSYERAHPGEAVEIKFLPIMVRMLFRGMSLYDPNFGNAFYNGRWNENFAHSEALKKIQCPALLLQASFKMMEDGTLDGAMSKEDADKAMSLIQNGKFKKIKAMHVIHLDKPDVFIKIMNEFFLNE